MIDVKIDNIFVVLNQIERLGNGIENRYLLMRRLSETMHTAVKLNFRYADRPKWLGLKYRDGKLLSDSGRLKDSFFHTVRQRYRPCRYEYRLCRHPQLRRYGGAQPQSSDSATGIFDADGRRQTGFDGRCAGLFFGSDTVNL